MIFIDETWAKTNLARLRGRAPRGQRLVDQVPQGHWKTTTLIAALDMDGVRCSMVVDGAVNADIFEAFVQQVLLPQLEVGDVVVLDNLSSHKRRATRQIIEASGAQLLFLPPYSPDLNPIEQVFAKLKARLRKAAARSLDDLIAAIADALRRFRPDECANYLASAGYST